VFGWKYSPSRTDLINSGAIFNTAIIEINPVVQVRIRIAFARFESLIENRYTTGKNIRKMNIYWIYCRNDPIDGLTMVLIEIENKNR
jgi:hypothetical protein